MIQTDHKRPITTYTTNRSIQQMRTFLAITRRTTNTASSLGKGEVHSSILCGSTIIKPRKTALYKSVRQAYDCPTDSFLGAKRGANLGE